MRMQKGGTNGSVFCFQAHAGRLVARAKWLVLRRCAFPGGSKSDGYKTNNGRGGALTFQNELDRERRRKPDDEPATPGHAHKPRKRRGQTAEVGDALRDIYKDTVQEGIPPEMLDLLGKLDG